LAFQPTVLGSEHHYLKTSGIELTTLNPKTKTFSFGAVTLYYEPVQKMSPAYLRCRVIAEQMHGLNDRSFSIPAI